MDQLSLTHNQTQDHALHLTCVCSHPRYDSIVVDIETLTCGALLTDEHDSPGEFFVLDTIDNDFWWHMKSVNLAHNVNL